MDNKGFVVFYGNDTYGYFLEDDKISVEFCKNDKSEKLFHIKETKQQSDVNFYINTSTNDTLDVFFDSNHNWPTKIHKNLSNALASAIAFVPPKPHKYQNLKLDKFKSITIYYVDEQSTVDNYDHEKSLIKPIKDIENNKEIFIYISNLFYVLKSPNSKTDLSLQQEIKKYENEIIENIFWFTVNRFEDELIDNKNRDQICKYRSSIQYLIDMNILNIYDTQLTDNILFFDQSFLELLRKCNDNQYFKEKMELAKTQHWWWTKDYLKYVNTDYLERVNKFHIELLKIN